MSDTPRTDAELERYRGPMGMVLAEFARQLERELRDETHRYKSCEGGLALAKKDLVAMARQLAEMSR